MTYLRIVSLCFAALFAMPAQAQDGERLIDWHWADWLQPNITILKIKPVPPDLKPVFGPPVYPPPDHTHLGPAVLHPDRPWQAERMPIKVKLPPIYDPWILPPEEFDHEYTGRMTIMRTDEAGIKTQCWGTSTQTACARPLGESCIVWIVYDDILNYQRMSYDVVFQHERAHCNGWRHANDRK